MTGICNRSRGPQAKLHLFVLALLARLGRSHFFDQLARVATASARPRTFARFGGAAFARIRPTPRNGMSAGHEQMAAAGCSVEKTKGMHVLAPVCNPRSRRQSGACVEREVQPWRKKWAQIDPPASLHSAADGTRSEYFLQGEGAVARLTGSVCSL